MRTVTAILVLPIALLVSGGVTFTRAQTPTPPFVIVQAVDPTWLPVPGAVVQLRERLGARTSFEATTNAEGLAMFRFAPPDAQQAFDISVTMAGFKKSEMKNVRFGTCSGDCQLSRYVQLRLDLPRLDIIIR
jgi:hypothetical protein